MAFTHQDYALQELAHPLRTRDDLDPLIDRIGSARIVLLGEASHGTSEYYTWRTKITKCLIEEKEFSFIAVEGDWPACYSVNRYIKNYPNAGEGAIPVLYDFERWPTWMWANWEIVALVEWLQKHNSHIPVSQHVGFYGLDVYSLWESLEEITTYLEDHDPGAVEAAKAAFMCFQPHDRDVQSYAWASQMVPQSCEQEVLELLVEIRRTVQEKQDQDNDHESAFSAEQNAHVAANAEKYYRTMIRGGSASWNVRDNHMVDTLERLMNFHGPDAKAIIWEHNTHIGDARATDMASAGMVNVGQLTRERWGQNKVAAVGCGSYEGHVIAGNHWGASMQDMRVPPARDGSWEQVFHQALNKNGLFMFSGSAPSREIFNKTLPHRAIGVVYHPERERYGNYVPTVLNQRYDAFLYVDQTQALHPLHVQPANELQPPETYPWAV